MSINSRHEKCWHEGYEGFAPGRSARLYCPYFKWSTQWAIWLAGWAEAEEDHWGNWGKTKSVKKYPLFYAIEALTELHNYLIENHLCNTEDQHKAMGQIWENIVAAKESLEKKEG